MKPLSERDPFRIGIVAIVIGGLVGLVILVLSVVSFGTSSYTAVLRAHRRPAQGRGRAGPRRLGRPR